MTEKQLQEITSLRDSLKDSRTPRDKAIAIAISRLFDHIAELEMRLEMTKIARINEEIKKLKTKSKIKDSSLVTQLVIFTV